MFTSHYTLKSPSNVDGSSYTALRASNLQRLSCQNSWMIPVQGQEFLVLYVEERL